MAFVVNLPFISTVCCRCMCFVAFLDLFVCQLPSCLHTCLVHTCLDVLELGNSLFVATACTVDSIVNSRDNKYKVSRNGDIHSERQLLEGNGRKDSLYFMRNQESLSEIQKV